MVAQLTALEGDDAARQRRHSMVHVAGSVETIGMTVSAVVTAVARTVFAFDSRVSIHRTGMFLLMYLVVHMVRLHVHIEPGGQRGDIGAGFSCNFLPLIHFVRFVSWAI